MKLFLKKAILGKIKQRVILAPCQVLKIKEGEHQ